MCVCVCFRGKEIFFFCWLSTTCDKAEDYVQKGMLSETPLKVETRRRRRKGAAKKNRKHFFLM